MNPGACGPLGFHKSAVSLTQIQEERIKDEADNITIIAYTNILAEFEMQKRGGGLGGREGVEGFKGGGSGGGGGGGAARRGGRIGRGLVESGEALAEAGEAETSKLFLRVAVTAEGGTRRLRQRCWGSSSGIHNRWW